MVSTMQTLGSIRDKDSHKWRQLMAYRSSKSLYANQIVLWSSQVFDTVSPTHTDEQKFRNLGAGRVPATSSTTVKSVNRGTLVAKLSFFLFRVSNFSCLEDELIPIFIGSSSSGVLRRI